MRIIGRQREVDELRALLAGRGAVVVVGPPGIGKSALAAALGPQLWVDLEGIAREEALQTALVRALGCEIDNAVAVREALRGVALLVLDGAERGPSIGPWLGVCPALVTSRRRLDLDAPVLDLGPLEPAAGAELLRARVKSARQAQALDESELRELSVALDGVPLALELAAPALRLYAPRALLSRALDQLSAPKGAQLLDAVRESVGQLSERSAAVLSTASVLTGPFDTGRLAMAVGGDVDDALLELLDAALLHPLGEVPPRFRLLAPIRAVVRPDEAARQEVIARLAGILPEAEREMEALTGAGSPRDLAPVLPVLELLLDSADPAVRLRAGIVLAAVEQRAGPAAATLRRDPLLAGSGPAPLRVRWALAVASAACQVHDGEVAEAALARVQPLLTDTERPAWLAARAQAAAVGGRLDEASALATEAARSGTDPWLAFRLAVVCWQRGDLPAAIDGFRSARRGAGAFRYGQATYGICAAMHDAGHPPDAVLTELALAEAQGAVVGWLAPRLRAVRAVIHAGQGDFDAARAALERAEAEFSALGEPDEAVNLWLTRQSVEVAAGSLPLALLDPPACSQAVRPRVVAWTAIAHAMRQEWAEAEALGPGAIQSLRDRALPDADEIACYLAVALGPARPQLAADLLGDGPLADLARTVIGGILPEPASRLEDRVVVALGRHNGRRVRVVSDGSAFRTAGGEVVELRRRKVLRRVLAALAASEVPLDVETLCEQVWPGETLVGDSGTRRVHVAVSSLRALGLRQALQTESDDGPTRWHLIAERVDKL